MVDDRYLGSKGDVAVSGPDSVIVEHWAAWTQLVREQGSIMIAQLNHPGRQSPLGAGNRSFLAKTIAPSAIPLNLGENLLASLTRIILFGTPQKMTLTQIDNVIAQFTRAARLALRAGFHGVEVHAGHGFLLSQFLSSSANNRSDEFGGSAEKRVELVIRIIRAIRQEVPASFCVGIKINTADHIHTVESDDLLLQIDRIAKEQVDYVQLSGGSFEDPKMLSIQNSLPIIGATGTINVEREGFFLQASHEIRKRHPNLVLLVTGGFRSRNGVNSALQKGACDLIGLARPAIKYPDLPNEIVFNDDLLDGEARFDVEPAPSRGWIATKIRSVGAGAETTYYLSFLQAL
ncbi:hypothetical protein BGZ60DRAFT_463079 [Tricladium varicosporioides]|nr:hypothetical protein BGZ60DRAFT_463079 [Hymenoscyphus varicosporioides]